MSSTSRIVALLGLGLSQPAFTQTVNTAASAQQALPQVGVSGADYLGSVLALAGIVALLFGGSYLLKRLKLVGTPAELGVKLVGQIPLSGREKFLVLQVGDEKILVGSGAGNMRTLHRWASPETESVMSAFEKPVFAGLMRRYGVNRPTVSSSSTGEKQDLPA